MSKNRDKNKKEIKEKNSRKNKEKVSNYEKELRSYKIKEREMKAKIIKIAILITILFLIIIYFLLRIIYDLGNFTVTLDSAENNRSGLVMYESIETKEERKVLEAERLEYMDNISIDWLPDNLNNEADGSHNGDNYIAYTFYLENMGSDVINYWYKINIEDVIKNVDTAIRVMIYLNDDRTVYAKTNAATGEPEPGTEPFYSDTEVLLEERTDFNPGDIDKMTIVIWIEGDDPDCLDPLIGGEMKMSMEITEEHIEQE